MAIEIEISKLESFFASKQKSDMLKIAENAHKSLFDNKNVGSELLGWIDLPLNIQADLKKINDTANEIKNNSKVLVVIGVGGSYLGARSAIEFLKSPNYNIINKSGQPQIFFVGYNISADYLAEIIEIIGDRDFSVNMISKSGNTLEPTLAFHFFEKILKNRYPSDWSKRVYVTTDETSGDLRKYAQYNNCISFALDSDVGGRFSVLSAVGLLPMACVGIDIAEMICGAIDMRNELSLCDEKNPALLYAYARNLAYINGKTNEILAISEPRVKFVGEWWKQLFAESEGKDKKGIYPSVVEFSTELHSVGQYIQDGLRNIFETVICVKDKGFDLKIEDGNQEFSSLGLFEGLTLNEVNEMATKGAVKAHIQGEVPCIEIKISDMSARSYGELVYFFEVACAISGYMLGVNPFDQPGVNAYKDEMTKLVSKKFAH